MKSKIIKCSTCEEHEFQDKTYGYKMRVANKCTKSEAYRCTVCGRDQLTFIKKNK